MRLHLFEELGESRVTEILAITYTETPTTADERLRAQAHTVEVDWTRLLLMETMPMLFADGNNDNGQIFHDEAVFRRPAGDQMAEQKSRLWDAIQLGLSRLHASNASDTDRNRVRFGGITPEATPPAPGDTGKPCWRIPKSTS